MDIYLKHWQVCDTKHQIQINYSRSPLSEKNLQRPRYLNIILHHISLEISMVRQFFVRCIHEDSMSTQIIRWFSHKRVV